MAESESDLPSVASNVSSRAGTGILGHRYPKTAYERFPLIAAERTVPESKIWPLDLPMLGVAHQEWLDVSAQEFNVPLTSTQIL